MVQNKKKDFPIVTNMDGAPRAKAKYSPQRANGTTNTRPRERMQQSSNR